MKFKKVLLLLALLSLSSLASLTNTFQLKHSNSKSSEGHHENSILSFFNELYGAKKSSNNNNTNEKLKLQARFKAREEEVESVESSFSNFMKLRTNNSPPPAPREASSASSSADPAAPSAESSSSTSASSSSSTASADQIVEGWLRISSYDFLNESKYPAVALPKEGQFLKIKTDRNRFRINLIYTKDPNNPDTKFYFRMNKDHIYYSCTKDDMNVMGAVDIAEIKSAERDKIDDTCFKIILHNKVEYDICGEDIKTKEQWYCAISLKLDKPDETCIIKPAEQVASFTPTIEIEQKVYQPIILIPQPSEECNHNFNYNKRGSDWECQCSEGKEQSPINIDSKSAFKSQAAPVFVFDEVDKTSFISSLDGTLTSNEPIKIRYYRGAVRIFHTKFGKVVTLDGAVYHAEEIVFHTPSEHMIDGVRSEMEMQVICYGQTKGDIAKQVVISFLFEKKPGVYNKFLDDVDFFNLPNKQNPEKAIMNNLNLNKVLYSTDSNEIETFRPVSLFTYQGSISFPPCTERTINYVVKDPIPVASSVIEMLKESIKESKDEVEGEIENIREVQPLNGRDVFFYDASMCKPAKYSVPKIENSGHYEKMKKKVTEYFFVNGVEPSGLPDSYVVTESEAQGIPDARKTD